MKGGRKKQNDRVKARRKPLEGRLPDYQTPPGSSEVLRGTEERVLGKQGKAGEYAGAQPENN